jgi:hypothetical protein
VVWTEVVSVMFPSLAFSFVSGAVDQKKDQQIVDEDGNVVVKTAEAELDFDEMQFEQLTVGMNEEQRDALRLRTLDAHITFEDTNPMVVRLYGSAAKEALEAAEAAGDAGDVPEALLSLQEQSDLQNTVATMLAEINALKKKVAQGGQASGSLADKAQAAGRGGLKKKKGIGHKDKDGGGGGVSFARGGSPPRASISPPRGKESGQAPLDMGSLYGGEEVSMSSNPMSRGANFGGGNPMAAAKKPEKKTEKKAAVKAARMTGAAFESEDLR